MFRASVPGTPPAGRLQARYRYGVTSWADHAIWWQVTRSASPVRRRRNSAEEEPVQHRLRQLEGWLDSAVELGCSGLLLGPVFAAETHGYDTTNHFQIDPRLGDQDDFDQLIDEAGRRGLRVVLDGVFNHVSRSFPVFQAALAGGPSCPPPGGSGKTPRPASTPRSRATTSSSSGITRSPRFSTTWRR